MHMADALLSPATGSAFWAGSLAVIAYSAKKLKERLDEKLIPLMGVLASFIFAAQMINFTIPGTGSSGHLGGGMILAILLGPFAGFIAIASVLLIQSLFFADGGLLALGCNIWNLGVYPCFFAYPLVYKKIAKNKTSQKRIIIASVLGAVLGLQLGAVSVILQTVISGKSELSFSAFSSVMIPIHLAIGLIEGFITAGVINYVRSAKPEILEHVFNSQSTASGLPAKNVIRVLLILTVITGGILSWFASTNPDGLEWSLERIYGRAELHEQEKGLSTELHAFQDKTAFLPDYDFPHGRASSSQENQGRPVTSWPGIDTGRSLSGIVGAAIVFVLIGLFGVAIKRLRKKKI